MYFTGAGVRSPGHLVTWSPGGLTSRLPRDGEVAGLRAGGLPAVWVELLSLALSPPPPPISLFPHPRHLFVHHDVDDRVVDGGALGKESWHGHKDGAKVGALVGEDVDGHARIGEPADQEEDDHEDDHAGDFLLSLLGGG